MNRRPYLCITLTLLLAAPSYRPAKAQTADSEPGPAAWMLGIDAGDKDFKVRVAVPAGTYVFEAVGSCTASGDAIRAEGQSEDGMFSIDVSKDEYSGLTVFFSNNEDEWEIMSEGDDDMSEIVGNRFRFSGRAMRNYEETDMQSMEVELLCPGS